MMGCNAHAALAEALGSLAGYNDKGFAWSGHGTTQVEAHRQRAIAEIRDLVERIGRHRLPPTLLDALDSGALAEDASGRYAEMLQGG